jgi:hypothetical protein
MQKLEVDRSNCNKPEEAEVIDSYNVLENLDRFATCKNLEDNVNIHKAWESMRGKTKASATAGLGY